MEPGADTPIILHFYPRSPCGERQLEPPIKTHRKNFYPRSPCGERLFRQNYECFEWIISIHALLAESDISSKTAEMAKTSFLSTLSLRRATSAFSSEGDQLIISIHALLAESDSATSAASSCRMHFYPRSPCGERLLPDLSMETLRYFYPRSPCGERLLELIPLTDPAPISIHALLAESDRAPPYNLMIHHIFLSTLSLRRATPQLYSILCCDSISIHALLAESDHYIERQNQP